ncbi:MAG: SPASM domain-containing protein [Desulfomonilaceae bacterium]
MYPINAINFALSNACTARCVYCPKDRGDACDAKHMSLDVMDSVLDSVQNAPKHLKATSLRIRLGENGDMFLNPDVIEIMRRIRKRFANATIEMYNHFYLVEPAVTEVVLKENLVNAVYLNIDGTHDNYRKTKNIRLDKPLANLTHFIGRRDALGLRIPVSVRALTLADYLATVSANYNRHPKWVKPENVDAESDYKELAALMSTVLKSGLDSFKKSVISLWGERDSLGELRLDARKFACPLLFRIRHELCVRPDGGCYLCCADSKQELLIGNLTKESFQEVVGGETRRSFIESLIRRDFHDIGGPCMTVYCCQVHHKSRLITHLFRFATQYAWLLRTAYELWRRKWGVLRSQ